MPDIRASWLLYLKATLLLLAGIAGAAILLLEHPELRFAALLAVTVWAFCRAYYFAFYVIEHYVDPGFRFAGLLAFARYAWGRRRARPRQPDA